MKTINEISTGLRQFADALTQANLSCCKQLPEIHFEVHGITSAAELEAWVAFLTAPKASDSGSTKWIDGDIFGFPATLYYAPNIEVAVKEFSIKEVDAA